MLRAGTSVVGMTCACDSTGAFFGGLGGGLGETLPFGSVKSPTSAWRKRNITFPCVTASSRNTCLNQTTALTCVRYYFFPCFIATLQGRAVSQYKQRSSRAGQRNVHPSNIYFVLSLAWPNKVQDVPDKNPTFCRPGPARTHDRIIISFSCPWKPSTVLKSTWLVTSTPNRDSNARRSSIIWARYIETTPTRKLKSTELN